MNLRFATPDDSLQIRDIYAQYIEPPVTFECALPSAMEFSKRIADISAFYPYLICEEDGKIMGYAYAHRHMEREAYQWNAELSVYLDQSFASQGLGKKMYTLLIEILKLQGIKTVYGGVTSANEKSEALHKALGFQVVGIYHKAGYKAGKWHDVTWFEKAVSEYDPLPQPVISITGVPQAQLQKIIKQ